MQYRRRVRLFGWVYVNSNLNCCMALLSHLKNSTAIRVEYIIYSYIDIICFYNLCINTHQSQHKLEHYKSENVTKCQRHILDIQEVAFSWTAAFSYTAPSKWIPIYHCLTQMKLSCFPAFLDTTLSMEVGKRHLPISVWHYSNTLVKQNFTALHFSIMSEYCFADLHKLCF